MLDKEPIRAKDAEDFVDKLRPREWAKSSWEIQDWCFRGLRKAKYDLLPSAWRRDDDSIIPQVIEKNKELVDEHISFYFSLLKRDVSNISQVHKDRIISLTHQTYAEYILILSFHNRLNHFGLAIENNFIDNDNFISTYITHLVQVLEALKPKPRTIEDSIRERYIIERGKDDHSNKILEIWKTPTVAIAQHHGIPTRLLDWTTDPRVAAYFAASNFGRDAEDIAVIAMPIEKVQNYMSRIRIIRVLNSASEYIQRQAGIFTLDFYCESYFLKNGQFPHFDRLSNEGWTKLVLDANQASEVLRLLSLERISSAYLMPTVDQIAKSVIMQWEATP